MATEFQADWLRLLLARSVEGDESPPISAMYRYALLEKAIESFSDKGTTDEEKAMLELALKRVSSNALRLTYLQVVGAAKPWVRPEPDKAVSATWHDAIPVGLLVLVAAEFETVEQVMESTSSLDVHWNRLAGLFAILQKRIADAKARASWSEWQERLNVTLALPAAWPSGKGNLHSWVTVDFSDAKQGRWLLPAFMTRDSDAEARLAFPTKPEGFAPESGARASVFLDDPRSLVPLTAAQDIEFDASSIPVRMSVPWLAATDELTWASSLLSRYRLVPGAGATEAEKVSLWDAALALDPGSAEALDSTDVGSGPWGLTWSSAREVYSRRLKTLADRGKGEFSTKSFELLTAACWARRLSHIAAEGLAYPSAGEEGPIQPIAGAEEAVSSGAAPPEADDLADNQPWNFYVARDPLMCAFYLAIRLGASASSSSARSLDILSGDISLGVAGLLMPPELVYVDAARQIRKRVRTSEKKGAAQTVSDWLRGARPRDFRAGMSFVGIDVVELCGKTPDLVEAGEGGREVANLSLAAGHSGLGSPRSQYTLVKTLAKAYANPPVGGLPAFIANLVSNGLSAGSSAPPPPTPVNEDTEPAGAAPAGLVRLLAKGFPRCLPRQLTERAEELKVPALRGARDIVRYGRGAFVSRFSSPLLSRELLSRVYSRSWSKANVRAQFIASTRSTTLPATPEEPSSQDQTASGLPDLATLFDLTDLPACNWGDSIHGPAAYLADVLEFLRHRRLIAVGSQEEVSCSALSLLLGRRGELAEIDLNEKNATVEMPFIDLVNEALEGHLAGSRAFSLAVDLDWEPPQPLEERDLQALQTALQPWGLHLQVPVATSKVPESTDDQGCQVEQWVLRDRAGIAIRVWRHVKGRSTERWQARLMPQTTLSASELAAEPQFVERRAYERLSAETVTGSYSLPWSLGEAQLGELLALVDVKVGQLLEFARPDVEIKSDSDWLPRSLATLGVSQTEGAKCIFSDDASDKLLLEVERGRAAPYALKLKDFLQRSGLGFEDVQILTQIHALDRSGFRLNPVKTAPCSADSNQIEVSWDTSDGPATAAKFLRLRKRLGWTLTELDLACVSPNLGDRRFDSRFARKLSQLRAVSQVLELSTLDTLRIFTRLRTTPIGKATSSDWAAVFLDPRIIGADVFRDAPSLTLLRTLIASKPGSGNRRPTVGELLALSGEDARPTLEGRVRTLICAALRVSSTDLQVLVTARHGATAKWLESDCERLSQLYGASLLMRSLGLAPAALQALVAMVAGNPFEDPQVALELFNLKQEAERAGLGAAALRSCLSRPADVNLIDGDTPPACRPAVVMDTVLALHKALRATSTLGSAALLQVGTSVADEAPGDWLVFLEETGASLSGQATWGERIGLLREPIRRQLPRIKADLAKLRRERTLSLQIGSVEGCDKSGRLLADELQGVEVLLGQELPAGLDPLLDAKDRVVTAGVDLLHPVVRRWILDIFAPVLQWVGLEREELVDRLAPWMETMGDRSGFSAPRRIASFPSNPESAALLASYLLCRPLERHALREDRRSAVAAQLSASLATTPELAWALLTATPVRNENKGVKEELNAAEWWLRFLANHEEGPWLGPVALALDRINSDADLLYAFGHTTTVSLAWSAIGGLGLNDATIDWLYATPQGVEPTDRSSRLKVLSPNDLMPLAPPQAAALDVIELAARWRRLAVWAKVLQESPDVVGTSHVEAPITLKGDVLDVLFSKGSSNPLTDDEWSGLTVACERLLGLSRLAATGLLSKEHSAALLEPQTYSWLRGADRLLAGTGLSPKDLSRVAGALSATDEDTRLATCGPIRASLRRRFSDATWQQALRKGQDRIREQKRDALVDSLLARPQQPWKGLERSKDQLYEYLLLDTQMAACMTTSRIVQAHATVQQFAQRCTMGLERGWQIPAGELIDWKQWSWMGTYRIWEASRKIFIYPENWMEPEIRDDKSPFFQELESDLNQGEMTNENAETAFVRYLHKLHDVARLDVLATYYEFDPNEPVMHVLGRTPSEPYRYFYRQWIDERRWTPWEPVDLEIESNHVVLFKRGGRIYIGWMTSTHEENRPVLPKTFTTTQTGNEYAVKGVDEPTVRWKLQLTTSQRAKEGWQAKRTSPGHLSWPLEYAPMSLLTQGFGIERLQLVFQDYGVPEILVFRVDPDLTPDPDMGIDTNARRQQIGSFSLASCLGVAVPELVRDDRLQLQSIFPVVAYAPFEGFRYLERAGMSGSPTETLNLVEGSTANSIAHGEPSVLQERVPGIDPTPGQFAVTLASQASMLDLAMATARAALVPTSSLLPMTMGLGLPIFYSDDAVDIAVRLNFSPVDGEEATGALVSMRHIARVLGGLRAATETEAVQERVWAGATNDDEWAKGVLRAVEQAAPAASAPSVLALLEAVSRPYPEDARNSPFELAARTHHPLACELVNRAEGRGVSSVFSQRLQLMRREEVYRGRSKSWLSDEAIKRFPKFALCFEQERDAYAIYNWEAFFHTPFLVAMKFAGDGKFEDAIRWFHYIFDPIGVGEEAHGANGVAGRGQFWKTQPFRTEANGAPASQRIDVLLDPEQWPTQAGTDALQDLVDSVMAWRRQANLPFQVARGRWVAFQTAVVYRYIDTLISWGDARFRVDTREEITAASQFYVLAARLLGRRPRTDITMCERSTEDGCGTMSYEQLQELIDRRDDELSEHLDELLSGSFDELDCMENEEPDSPHLNFYNEYFCIPPNEKLFELWDRVADRLYKVRNCLNIDGVFRIPSLFAPPIDPALLARAGAAGLSFDQIVAGMNQPRSHYRFSVVLQKANEVAAEVRVLGAELLQALEKRDAEELSLLRSRLDLQAIRLNKEIRDQQIKEARTQLEVIATQIGTAERRRDWYLERIAKGASAKELESIEGVRSGLLVRTRVAAMKSTAAIYSLLPQFTVGFNGGFGSPHFAMQISGSPAALAQNYFADKLAVEGDKDQTAAGITATLAGYERRREEWEFQRDTTAGELAQLQKQRIASEIRLAMALVEKRNLEKSIESAESTDAFLKSKFTNAGLYDWMVRQVSAVYYKTYQLAVDYARTAEDCLNRELPLSQAGVRVIGSDHWDGLRKGLLAATGLIHDLKRLEAEQVKRNKRVPELTKHVSLAIVDPWQLLQFRATGRCSFKVPEALFDMDHPGQFARRIKSVALSVPCITGPYSSVSCKVSLSGSDIRSKDPILDVKAIERDRAPAEAIFTSAGNNDSGLWEPNLRDERYLPFEGAGAVNSEWRVELPAKVRQFDYASISDVVLHIRYTAEPTSNPEQADRALADKLKKPKTDDGLLWVYTSLQSDLADQFAALLGESDGKPVRLKLPRRLARWMGQTIAPTGAIKIALIGTSSGTPAVRLNSTDAAADRVNDAQDYWHVDIVSDPKALLGEDGFEFSVRGMSRLSDVVIFLAGKAEL